MRDLREKLKKESGFTLIEMLIVVAIIAILIAISIPMVNGALERARDATDQANERAAKAEALLYYMGTVSQSELTAFSSTYKPGDKLEAYYDAEKGTLKSAKTGIAAYGKCHNLTDCYQKDRAEKSNHTTTVIKVVIDPAGSTPGEATITWDAAATS